MNASENRQWYLDILRITSIAFIVVIHTSGQCWADLDVDGYKWAVANLFDGASRWTVPVFVMISGALFLNPEKSQPIKKLYSKNILRIFTTIIFWGFVYALINKPPANASFDSLYEFFKIWVLGHYHMWFLYMIAGLYVVTPILRRITSDKQTTVYFLILAFIVNTVIPFMTSFGHLSIATSLLAKMMFQIPMGYSFYFVLGYYLNSLTLTKRISFTSAIIFIFGIAATTCLTYFVSVNAGEGLQTFYKYLSLPVCIASVGAFLLGKSVCNVIAVNKPHPIIKALSASTLGVYMIHIIVLDWLKSIGLYSMAFNPLFAIPATALAAIAISYTIAFIMSKIPIFNKYCV